MRLGKFIREIVVVPNALTDDIDDPVVLDERLDDPEPAEREGALAVLGIDDPL